MEKYIVLENEENIRIDNYVASKTGISRSKIQSLIEQDKVLVNTKEVRSSYKTKMNDEVSIEYVEEVILMVNFVQE